MKVLIYYHNDPDGIMSGAIAKKHFEEDEYQYNIECRKINYNYNFEKEYKYLQQADLDILVIVDFCFPEEYMNRFHRVIANCNIIWIDHHPIIDTIKFNKETPLMRGLRSKDNAGCMLTWKYFFPDIEIPDIVKYIEDLDLWKFNYTETKPFINYFDMVCKSPEDVLELFDLEGYSDNTLTRDFISYGNILVGAQNRRVQKSFEQGKDIIFEGYKTRSINSNHDISQIGEYCYKEKDYPIGMIWQVVGNNIIVGLRSNTKSKQKIDVGELARKYNGNGHFHSAGMVLNLDQIDIILNGTK